jgi:hypothetical protein
MPLAFAAGALPFGGQQESTMQPEDRVKRHEDTIQRLKEDVEWLHETGFWTEVATNAELIASNEQAIVLYVSIVRELTRPVG